MFAKVFNKGQVVIPALLRKKYNIKSGDKINIIAEDDGIKIVPKKQLEPIENLAGIFSKYAHKKITDPDINKITEDSFTESFKDEIY